MRGAVGASSPRAEEFRTSEASYALDERVALDSLWVYWYPGMLSKWSRKDRNWTDYLFAGASPDEPPVEDDIEVAEDVFLEGIGWTGGSPWRMAFS